MADKLREMLDARAKQHGGDALLREAAELARRFDGAPVAVVECNDAKGAWLVTVDDAPLYKGQRVRLVPEPTGQDDRNG